MKFIVLGNYNENGLSGFIKNPNEDRKSVITAMMEKAGGRLDNLFLTRGKYDIVAICDAPDFETMGALKMLIMNSGAISKMDILEESDFNKMASKASSMMGTYKAPGA